jgi:periplasmic mercuric ion binding protein
MRNVLVLALALTLGSVSTAAAARVHTMQSRPAEAIRTCTLKVTGMTCAGCEAAVKLAAKRIAGVKTAKASYAHGTAEVTFDPAKTTAEVIARTIAQKTGYRVEVPK